MEHLEKAMSDVYRTEVEPVFLYSNGARIPSILKMLLQYKETNEKKVPVMVVIVGLLGDCLLKKNSPEGHSVFKIREEVRSKKLEYPALEGLSKMRADVEGKLVEMWPGVRILWILPFPVDLGTYVRTYATEPISRRVECNANQVSLEVNNYMAAVDKRLQRGSLDWDVLPWYHFWKDVSGQKENTPCEFHEFMGRLRKGERAPVLCPDASLDGLNPRIRTSQGLIRAIVRKYRYTLAHPTTVPATPVLLKESPVSVPASTPASAQEDVVALANKVDQACQVDEGMERNPPVIRRTVLPCLCTQAIVTTVEEGFLCEDCDTFFLRDKVYLDSFWSIYKCKP